MRELYGGSHRGSAIACYIDEQVMNVSGYDEMTTHPAVSEGCALIGRRVFSWDDFGFVGVFRFATLAEARATFEAVQLAYDTLATEDDEEETK